MGLDYKVLDSITVIKEGKYYATLRQGDVFKINRFNYENIDIDFLKNEKLLTGVISYNQLKYGAQKIKE